MFRSKLSPRRLCTLDHRVRLAHPDSQTQLSISTWSFSRRICDSL